MRPSLLFCLLLTAPSLVGLAVAVGAEAAAPPPTIQILADTLHTAATALAAQPEPVSHLAYAWTEEATFAVQGTHGALARRQDDRDQALDLEVRVGSYALDNTHKILDEEWSTDDERPQLTPPISPDPLVARLMLLQGTDDLYRQAARRLVKVRANSAVKVEREDTSPDFSAVTPVTDWAEASAPLDALGLDKDAWTQQVKEASARFLAVPTVYDSAVALTATRTRRTLVTSDGTQIVDLATHYRVAAWGSTVAPDGMELGVYDYVDTARPDGLPDAAALAALVDGVAQRLAALRDAPLIDPFEGPAILRGRAAGVFFHEIFGHRVEGHRQKDEDEGQTFTGQVGKRILPSFLQVEDDPTRRSLSAADGLPGRVDLNGYYRYDDEGVPAQRVPLVKDGVLQGFLMSRAPIEGFPSSNGHGRRQPGNAPVARQANLIVRSSQPVSYAQLRAKLLDEIRRQGKPFGLIFDDISGGFTFTGRATPNSFVVQPVTVWKVFPDGRPDQLVRGVDLIGTPLVAFSRILAAADDPAVFNGSCGAESGWVPVSAVAPSMLVQQVEVQRREKGNSRPPILPPPLPAPSTQAALQPMGGAR